MTSEAKILANRRNAQRSTGPRAAPAKARVRRNALRHGLAALVLDDPALQSEKDRVAADLIKGGASHLEAHAIAEARTLISEAAQRSA